MRCAICDRPHSKDLPFNCVGCARGFIYNSRLDALSAILENENLSDRVGKIHDLVVHKSKADSGESGVDGDAVLASQWRTEQRGLLLNGSKERISSAHTEIASLRQHIQQLKDETRRMSTTLNHRRLQLEDSRKAVSEMYNQRLGETSSHTSRVHRSYESLNKRTTEAKLNLCREAALLMGLKHRRKRRHGDIFELYSISRLLIPDLREISGMGDLHSRLLPVTDQFQVSNLQSYPLSYQVSFTLSPLQRSI